MPFTEVSVFPCFLSQFRLQSCVDLNVSKTLHKFMLHQQIIMFMFSPISVCRYMYVPQFVPFVRTGHGVSLIN